MPYERPGKRFYATATKAVNHGLPVIELAIVGVAIKQRVVGWDQGLAAQKVISIGEKFVIQTKGVVQVAVVGSPALGDPVYITAATNVLSLSSSGTVKYGRVVELAGNRGTPTGYMRVDLDAKDSF